jgi:hypothetical protein
MIAMRRLAASLFCVFLVYAGAADAFKGCLGLGDYSDHHFEGRHFDSGMSAAHDHSPSPSWSIIHCSTAEQRLGPALQIASSNLYRFDRVTSVHGSVLTEPGFPVASNSRWLEALFKRTRAFPLPNDLARHLLLSILQI